MPTAIKRQWLYERLFLHLVAISVHNSNTSRAPKLIAECTNRILVRRPIKQNSDQNISRSDGICFTFLGGVKFYLFSERYDKSVNMLCKFVKHLSSAHTEIISSQVFLNKSRVLPVFNCRLRLLLGTSTNWSASRRNFRKQTIGNSENHLSKLN